MTKRKDAELYVRYYAFWRWEYQRRNLEYRRDYEAFKVLLKMNLGSLVEFYKGKGYEDETIDEVIEEASYIVIEKSFHDFLEVIKEALFFDIKPFMLHFLEDLIAMQ
jgi:hypothetical protein